MRSFSVKVWNVEIEREYIVLAESHKDARNKIIREEIDRGAALYQIHIEHVNVLK